MATRQDVTASYHTCSCGAAFETTEDLLVHAEEEHGLRAS
jgi:hypothetical protein